MEDMPKAVIISLRKREQIKRLLESLTDAECSRADLLYDYWRPNQKYAVGDVRKRGDTLYRCITAHASETAWKPEDSPSLWERIMYRDGIRIIPEYITATSLFSAGELGWWGAVLYRSKVDYNAYTPVQYAANWEIRETEVK